MDDTLEMYGDGSIVSIFYPWLFVASVPNVAVNLFIFKLNQSLVIGKFLPSWSCSSRDFDEGDGN